MSFSNRRIRNVNLKFSVEDIALLKDDWMRFANTIKPYPKKFNGKGIVYTAGGVSYLTCAYVSISLLRKLGCSLPIEIWHRGNELPPEGAERFSHLDVKFKNFLDFEKNIPSGYALKPLAIFYSEFEEVLFLDADNNCIRDPEYLFGSDGYKKFGSTFWPDYWFTSRKNSIWDIIDSKEFGVPEQESGQIMINKQICWRELNLCIYFNRLGEYYYKILLGDKDTFKFAWCALKTPFFMIAEGVASCGYIDNGNFYGHTMVQHDENDQILFLHRNLMKWDITIHNEFTWNFIKKFCNKSPKGSVNIKSAPKGNLALDLLGDTTICRFTDHLLAFEQDCMLYLNEWREHQFYRYLLQYSHFAKNRYINGEFFSIDF